MLGPRNSPAQHSVSVSEKKVADEVAGIVQRVREQNRLPKLARIDDRQVWEDACSRAKMGSSPRGQRYGATGDKVGTLSVLWYSTLSPGQSQPELMQFAKGPDAEYKQPHRFSVGVCFDSKDGNAQAKYWIEVRMYMGTIKSFFYRAVWD